MIGRNSPEEPALASSHKPQGKGVPYRRVVAKLGTNLLTGGQENLDLEVMAALVGQIARLRQQGLEVLVVSSGAIAAGRHTLNVNRVGRDIPFRQVLAAVGQSRLMHTYEQLFESHGITVAQALVTRGDLSQRVGYLNVRNTLLALVELGVVPIINENDVVAVEEIGEEVFGDNDNLSAMVANLVDADLLALLTDIDGLYTADPRRDSRATLIPRVDRIDAAIEALAGETPSTRSRGGMATKIQAAKLATASGIDVAIANGKAPEILSRLIGGETMGTFFPAHHSRVESRKRWMLSALSQQDRLVIDDGAVNVLRNQGKSLLPAGVKAVEGDFQRGDIIYITDTEGAGIACGIVNYSSKDLQVIKGANSKRIHDLLGYEYGQEVVHRNNLVLL